MDDPKYKGKSLHRDILQALGYLILLFVITSLSCCTGAEALRKGGESRVKAPENLTASPESPADASHQGSSGLQPELSAVVLERDAGRIVVNIPVMESTRVNPEYKHPMFSLDFFPAIPQCTLPETDMYPLLERLQAVPALDSEGRWDSLRFAVNTKIRFLVSRPRPTQVRLFLEPAPPEGTSTGAGSSQSEADRKDVLLEDIFFSKDREKNQLITLQTTAPGDYKLLSSAGTQIKLLFPNLEIPAEFVKLFNLQEFETSVKSALLQNSPQGGVLELKTRTRSPIHIERSQNKLRLRIANRSAEKGNTPEKDQSEKSVQALRSGPIPEQNQAPDLAGPAEPQTAETGKHYTGQPISIDLQDAQVEHILRLIEAVAGYSFVLGQDVSGRMSLHLQNVPWDQALDIVLKELNLKKEVQQGNILRIMSYAKYNQEQEQEIKESQQRAQKILAQRDKQESKEESAPLMTRYIQVNYTTADELEPQLQSFLTERGKLNSDARTNQLIVHDTATSIKTVQNVVNRLDRPERQVLIEARLVYITDEFQRSMGINWGGSVTNSGGTSTGSGDLAINLPSAGAATLDIGGLISKVSGSDLFTLDAQLQLGESQNQVQTISSPRVLTLNNFRADMTQGTKIATQAESESGGTTTEYVEAVLDLSVLPQITPDNKIILDLEISDDSPTEAGDDIETRSATTKLIVDNEETVVIGGVQQLQESGGSDRVPGVSKIPLVGWLFKNKDIQKTKRELLIFIHPKIID